jgi:CheY-like chemotaxis protein
MTLTILYVEDSLLVSTTVKDTFECEGWSVEVCANGGAALERIMSRTHYDLFLIDYDLPEVNGVEIIRKIKSLPHRQHIPVVMFTASRFRNEAEEAGADLFLRKPDDMNRLVESVAGLMWHA